MTRLTCWMVAALLAGCAAGTDDAPDGGPGGAGGAGSGAEGAGGQGQGGGFGATTGSGGAEPGTPEVFGHSKTTLYKLNPETKAVGIVGDFDGCGEVFDIALDEASNLFGTNPTGLYRIDKGSAACTLVAQGTYPNSLSFVPKGTLEADREVLVGFVDDQYVRIDTETGAVSDVGAPWGNGFVSSGDVVSVKNGPTFLTIKDAPGGGTSCQDCLVEIDPSDGTIQKSYPSLAYDKVFGAAFWAGSVYGFTTQGEIFEITIENGQLSTTPIETPNGLSFWGAGSTTSAPPTPK